MTQLTTQQRRTSLAAMSATELDVLVIGGGVTGAGIALDAATRGLQVGVGRRPGLGRRHVQPVQQAGPRRSALPADARLQARARRPWPSAVC